QVVSNDALWKLRTGDLHDHPGGAAADAINSTINRLQGDHGCNVRSQLIAAYYLGAKGLTRPRIAVDHVDLDRNGLRPRSQRTGDGRRTILQEPTYWFQRRTDLERKVETPHCIVDVSRRSDEVDITHLEEGMAKGQETVFIDVGD